MPFLACLLSLQCRMISRRFGYPDVQTKDLTKQFLIPEQFSSVLFQFSWMLLSSMQKEFSPMPLQFPLMHFNATIFFLACLLSLQWIRSRRVASRRVMCRSTVWHNNSSGRTSILFDVRTILLDATSLSLTDIYCSGGWDLDTLCLAPVVACQSKIWQNNSPEYLFTSRC